MEKNGDDDMNQENTRSLIKAEPQRKRKLTKPDPQIHYDETTTVRLDLLFILTYVTDDESYNFFFLLLYLTIHVHSDQLIHQDITLMYLFPPSS